MLNYDAHHDGLMFVPALDVARGATPYRDVFTTYGPVVVFLQGLVVRLCGEMLIVIRLLTALFYGLDALLLWIVFARLLPPVWAAASVLGWLALAPFVYLQLLPWSSVPAIFFQIAALELALRGLERGSARHDLAAGGAVALAFLCRQSVGLFEAIALPAAVVLLVRFGSVERGRARAFALRFAGGALLAGLPFLLYFAAAGALADFYRQYLYYPVFSWRWVPGDPGIVATASRLAPVSSPLDLRPFSQIWLSLPALNLAVFAVLLVRGLRRRPVDPALWMLVAVAGASWSQYLPTPDLRHVFWAAAPMSAIPFLVVHRQVRRRGRGPVALALLCGLAIVFCVEIGKRVHGFARFRWEPHARMESPEALAGLWVPRDRAVATRELVAVASDYLDRHPDMDVVSLSRNGLYATFLPRRPRFHKLHLYFPRVYNDLYPGYEAALVARLLRRHSLVLAPSDWARTTGYRRVARFDETLQVSVFVPARLWRSPESNES